FVVSLGNIVSNLGNPAALKVEVLQESWRAANNRDNPQVSDAERQKILKQTKKDQKKVEIDAEVASTDSPDSSESSFSLNTGHTIGPAHSTKVIADKRRCGLCFGTLLKCCKCCGYGKDAQVMEKQEDKRKERKEAKPKETTKSNKSQIQATDVPRTFTEMFQWNCAVMGLSGRKWMQEILASFSAMVEHIADMRRLQQECNIVSIRIAKVTAAGVNWVNLSEFKSCMLAALRSLLPTVWDTTHEVAWNWLWDNIETILKKTMGKPLLWEQALQTMFATLSDEQLFSYRVQLYERFFSTVPAGQDYFKQSNTRLHFIAESATNMSLKLLQDPWQMVDDVSALGLRHVGYGIPTEMFGPFTEAAVDALRGHISDPLVLESFSWSLSIISQMLVHTVTEGSTIVMKAINNNSVFQLVKALSCAPRGERANWVLIVKVGTQDISPFRWAIESGSLSAAKAIIEDLLAIRADRERYYYGVDDLFQRHPDIIKILCTEAPMLLPTLLEGLIWRSRTVNQGMRRVNYYVKNLVVGSDGVFAGALPALVALGDPKIISHVAVDLVANLLWSGIVTHEFLTSKMWFIVSLVILMVSQTLLPEYRDTLEVRIVTFIFRVMTYALTLLRLLVQHSRDIFLAYYRRQTVRVFRIPFPKYLTKSYDLASFLLLICLVLMWANEPYIWCYNAPDWPTEYCLSFEEGGFIYSVFAMCAVGLHWGLMADLAVFSTGLSAFVLVCVHVGSEIGRFMFALMFLLTAFASAITVLEHHYEDMKTVSDTLIALSGITLRLYEDDYRDLQNDPLLLTAVFCFVTASAILLLNLLIAQLNCSYVYIYQNMLGYAKLKRSSVTVQTLAYIKLDRWSRFIATLGLDQPLEFNEGDVGMAGGIS
ncbi:KIF3A, partial [Symbiodinium pilosum]